MADVAVEVLRCSHANRQHQRKVVHRPHGDLTKNLWPQESQIGRDSAHAIEEGGRNVSGIGGPLRLRANEGEVRDR